MTNPPAHFDLARIRQLTGNGSKRFWSAVEELLDEEQFQDWLRAEFPSAAALIEDPGRRQFLKLMGASLLLSGLGGCGETKSDHARPYVNQPEAERPGVPKQYATAVLFEGFAQPVLAKTFDGRPVKLDGNPDHPAVSGKSDVFMQAAIFGLYDPERSQVPRHNGTPATWAQFARKLAEVRRSWRGNGGQGLRILSGDTTSPTLVRQLNALTQGLPNARWHCFEPVGAQLADEATALAFGRPLQRHLALEHCETIVSLEDDLLGSGLGQVSHARGWSANRREPSDGKQRVRLHVAESTPTATGAVASSRLPCNPSRLVALALGLGARLDTEGWTEPELTAAEKQWLDRAVPELNAHAGRSLLTAGAHLEPAIQAMAAVINDRLGNTGKTVWYSEPIRPATAHSFDELLADIDSGAVETLVLIDCNPAYTAAANSNFAQRLSRVPHRIHAGLYADETAALCEWHLPLSHALESWSDARAVDGTATIIQPVLPTLYETRSAHQFVEMLLGNDDLSGEAAVRQTWQQTFGADFDQRWLKALHDGFVADTAAAPVEAAAKAPSPPSIAAPTDELEIVFRPDPHVWDGRFANIAWLQELPKPLSKLTWDNVIEISPAIAAKFSVSNGDVLEVRLQDRALRGPALITPGQATQTVALSFGYGRRAGGEVAEGIGYDAFAVRPDSRSWLAEGQISRTDSQYPLASMQLHHRMEGADLVREVTDRNPATAPPKDTPTLYPPVPESEHAWGMVIDLDTCIGCNACIAACNAENNVAIVGKDQVARGREMIWLRVDHYYRGDIENPDNFFQPVPCMHCERAPCEMGCPVHATVHSPDGINQMVYNRCIGTRTCSSYCPYKVRRFNWYDWRDFAEASEAQRNPDVTVRSRGVMEKCTYCTQRVQAAHVQADIENRPLNRDEVATACQQACPTTAIVFGDLNDPESAVSKLRKSSRHYALLEELGTRPRTTYLAKWKDFDDSGDST